MGNPSPLQCSQTPVMRVTFFSLSRSGTKRSHEDSEPGSKPPKQPCPLPQATPKQNVVHINGAPHLIPAAVSSQLTLKGGAAHQFVSSKGAVPHLVYNSPPQVITSCAAAPQLVKSALPQPGNVSPLTASLPGVYVLVKAGDGSTLLQPANDVAAAAAAAATATAILPSNCKSGSGGGGGGVTVLSTMPNLPGAGLLAPHTSVITSPPAAAVSTHAVLPASQAVVPASGRDDAILVTQGKIGGSDRTTISAPLIGGTTVIQAGRPLHLLHSATPHTTKEPVAVLNSVTNGQVSMLPHSTLPARSAAELNHKTVQPAKSILVTTSPSSVMSAPMVVPTIKNIVHEGKGLPPPLVPLTQTLPVNTAIIKKGNTLESQEAGVGKPCRSPVSSSPTTAAMATHVSSAVTVLVPEQGATNVNSVKNLCPPTPPPSVVAASPPPVMVLVPAHNAADAGNVNTLIPITYNPAASSATMPIYRLGSTTGGSVNGMNGLQRMQILTPITLTQGTIA